MSTDKRFSSIPDLWGGIECSVNRVKSSYFDQLSFAGHYDRIREDIQLFKSLGISTMRYPVIWERLQPKSDAPVDWRSVDVALNALQEHNIQPIAGLVHHGSGPRYAEVQSPAFAEGLASFAREVAIRYPWVEYYTPVNEPLTTARFCGLYALWFPHKRNDRAFVRIFLNELKGVVLAMREVRKINPGAKLVQTEDIAKIYSTSFMKYQATFENQRRWLTWDILCGRLKEGHPLWKYFVKYAASSDDLKFFLDNPCPPDLIALDYYPTSERYLDEKLSKYPLHTHGHNHRHRYADVEAIRVQLNVPSGPYPLFKEVWERYHIPLVVSEVHIHCDPDNQIRWFSHIRKACIKLNSEGADVRAVTTWAMLGSFGWNQLLTAPPGYYESGAFDLKSGLPTPTPLADYLRHLSKDPTYIHPAQHYPGWWEEKSRFVFETEREEVAAQVLKTDCIER